MFSFGCSIVRQLIQVYSNNQRVGFWFSLVLLSALLCAPFQQCVQKQSHINKRRVASSHTCFIRSLFCLFSCALWKHNSQEFHSQTMIYQNKKKFKYKPKLSAGLWVSVNWPESLTTWSSLYWSKDCLMPFADHRQLLSPFTHFEDSRLAGNKKQSMSFRSK